MVPQDSRQPPPPRALSPETTETLRQAIAEHWRAIEGAQERLGDTLSHAVTEARELGLRPEEVIVALKQIEDGVLARPEGLRTDDPDVRRRFREWLVSSCLRAYFGTEDRRRHP